MENNESEAMNPLETGIPNEDQGRKGKRHKVKQSVRKRKPKWILALKQGLNTFKNYIQDSYGHTEKGLIIGSFLVITGVMTAFIKTAFPGMSICFLIIIGFILSLLVTELACLLTRLLLGAKRREGIYSFIAFLFVLSCTMIGSQGKHMGTCLLFAFLLTLCIGIFSRSIHALLFRRRYTFLTIFGTGFTMLFLILFTLFFTGEGFRQDYVENFLNLTEHSEVKMQDYESHMDLNYGNYEVGSLSYQCDKSESIDITQIAERPAIIGAYMQGYFGYNLKNVPLKGNVWYPKNKENNEVLFIIHGNHNYTVDSYMGYEYLGEYLASYGYVVVSVDENYVNNLSDENDARALMLLENIKYILEKNESEDSPLYHLINPEEIAIAGHSRGGEAVGEAYLFNSYDCYPDNGSFKFDYHFSIKSIIAIAPTVDQYQPASHEVHLEDVNYLLIHGANDQDVSMVMGEKQYQNITFTGNSVCFKSALYFAGANHGQFNTRWGKFDYFFPINCFLNVGNLLPEENQQQILKTYVKTFLDVTLRQDKSNQSLFFDYASNREKLPATIYEQIYQSSHFIRLFDFEGDSDITNGAIYGAGTNGKNFNTWKEDRRVFGNNQAGENYVLSLSWEPDVDKKDNPVISFEVPLIDMSDSYFQFDIADMREPKDIDEISLLDATVCFMDADGKSVCTQISSHNLVYSSLPVQLYKLDGLSGECEYKHQMQTVRIDMKDLSGIDCTKIVSFSLTFQGEESGCLQIDNIGYEIK